MEQNEILSNESIYLRKKTIVMNVIVALKRRYVGIPCSTDEMMSSGFQALLESEAAFDQKIGTNFSAFAYKRIRGAILDSISNISTHSSFQHRNRKAARTAYHRQMAKQRPKNCFEKRIKEPLINGFSEPPIVYEYAESGFQPLLDQQFNPEEICIRNELLQLVREKLERLPPLEKLVFEKHYFLQKTFAEISRDSGALSVPWISRLHARGLQRLQRALDSVPKASVLGSQRYYRSHE